LIDDCLEFTSNRWTLLACLEEIVRKYVGNPYAVKIEEDCPNHYYLE
jgi:hypothetical protein